MSHCPACRYSHPYSDADPERLCDCVQARKMKADPKAAALAAASSDRRQFDHAKQIILEWLDANQAVDANMVRPTMQAAQIKTATIGAAFGALVIGGEIEPVERVKSTDRGTHGKDVLLYRRGPNFTSPVGARQVAS